MKALDYLVEKYKVDLSKPSPHFIPMGRFKDVPKMFKELGFTKGAEVGTYRGTYARNLFRRIPGLDLTIVDLWDAYPGYKDFKDNDIREAETEARKNVEGFNCTVLKGWSNEVVDDIPDESLDFVFIDGNHAYEWVVWDIAKWSPKVKKGGVIYGHDYDDYSNKRRWKEMNVIPAVDGWMKSYKIDPWFVITNNRNRCWMYIKE